MISTSGNPFLEFDAVFRSEEAEVNFLLGKKTFFDRYTMIKMMQADLKKKIYEKKPFNAVYLFSTSDLTYGCSLNAEYPCSSRSREMLQTSTKEIRNSLSKTALLIINLVNRSIFIESTLYREESKKLDAFKKLWKIEEIIEFEKGARNRYTTFDMVLEDIFQIKPRRAHCCTFL